MQPLVNKQAITEPPTHCPGDRENDARLLETHPFASTMQASLEAVIGAHTISRGSVTAIIFIQEYL